ncbi:MAG: MATE family efflux transporter [Eubacterium sp.]|nr:MATE family efflux transporter [Eubacterium sp.]
MEELQTKPKENKMGTMPVGKLLFTMALPIIISMIIQALYNIVDSMYVSEINEGALTAVSLVFPIQNLMIAIATGTGVGINALLSRFLGEKKFEDANNVAHHGIFLGIISSLVVSVLMFTLAPHFIRIQTTDPAIYDGGVIYMRICCGLNFGIFMQITLERLLTATGKTLCTMTSQGIGAIINIIMDPLLIFGIGPFPEMGIAGAAAATVFGQCVAACIALTLNLRLNKEIHINMRKFRPNLPLIGEIYKIAIPSIVMVSIGSVMTFGMNMILIRYLESSTAAAVFGVYFKINSIIFMPIFGLNNAMVPIIAYNYGAKHRLRIRQTVRLAATFAVCLMLIGIGLFWIVPDKLLGIFHASKKMLAIGVPALRTISISFIFAGYCIVIGSVMQALGRAFYSMINSLTRQLILLLPSAFILAVFFGLDGVWWSYNIAEIGSLILTTIFYRIVRRELIDPLPD